MKCSAGIYVFGSNLKEAEISEAVGADATTFEKKGSERTMASGELRVAKRDLWKLVFQSEEPQGTITWLGALARRIQPINASAGLEKKFVDLFFSTDGVETSCIEFTFDARQLDALAKAGFDLRVSFVVPPGPSETFPTGP